MTAQNLPPVIRTAGFDNWLQPPLPARRFSPSRLIPLPLLPPPSLAERPDVAYSLVAVDFMSEGALHAALSRMAGTATSGLIRPLPLISHSMGTATAALRQMSQARHVGKVVVRAPAGDRQIKLAGRVIVTGEQCRCGQSGI